MIPKNKTLSPAEANQLSMLALAHVGDAVYELLVRSMLAFRGPNTVNELHRQTVARVRAEAQARAMKLLMPCLTEEELAVYKRGRNSHVHGIPPHANPGEYHSATGLEALFGWLWLQGKESRVEELFEITASTEENADGAQR